MRHAATVADNNDPDRLGRLSLNIPSYCGDADPTHPDWIPPLFSGGGPGVAGFFIVPPVGAAVFVDVDPSGELRWTGSDVGGVNLLPADLGVNYPRRSGFTSPVGRHILALDEDAGLLAIVEDDDQGAEGPHSYLRVGADGGFTIAGARGGLLYVVPDGPGVQGIALLQAQGGSLLGMQSGGEIQLIHEGGAEFLTLGGGVSRLNGTTVQISGGMIQLGDGTAPPINPYLLTVPYLADEFNALTEIAAGLTALGQPTVNTAAFLAKITASQGAGTPYLSTRIFGS